MTIETKPVWPEIWKEMPECGIMEAKGKEYGSKIEENES